MRVVLVVVRGDIAPQPTSKDQTKPEQLRAACGGEPASCSVLTKTSKVV